MTQNSSDNIPC